MAGCCLRTFKVRGLNLFVGLGFLKIFEEMLWRLVFLIILSNSKVEVVFFYFFNVFGILVILFLLLSLCHLPVLSFFLIIAEIICSTIKRSDVWIQDQSLFLKFGDFVFYQPIRKHVINFGHCFFIYVFFSLQSFNFHLNGQLKKIGSHIQTSPFLFAKHAHLFGWVYFLQKQFPFEFKIFLGASFPNKLFRRNFFQITKLCVRRREVFCWIRLILRGYFWTYPLCKLILTLKTPFGV